MQRIGILLTATLSRFEILKKTTLIQNWLVSRIFEKHI